MTDRQTVRVRQATALGVGVLVLILLVVAVRGCLGSAKENALKDYNREVASLVAESDKQVGEPFFKLIEDTGQDSPTDLQTKISGFRVQAEQQFKQAQDLDVPDEMVAAHRSLEITLEFRRDGLAAIAERIRAALSDDAEAADAAITEIAGEMEMLLASDVTYEARVIPLIKSALDEAEIGGQTIARSKFLPGVEWLSPAYVAGKLGQQAPSDSDGGRTGEPAPGLHGTGLQGVSAGDVTLQVGAPNRIPASTREFVVRFTNQGENDEFDVKAVLRIEGGSKTIRAERTIDTVARGATAEASLQLDEAPPTGVPVTIAVEVRKVPGEEKTDNNKAEYQALFVG